LIRKVEEKRADGRVALKDVWSPCHCAEKQKLRNRFKHALIPDEFENARFSNYNVETDVQRKLYEATKSFLSELQRIIDQKEEHNSLGFIAVYGESSIRELDSEERHNFKQKHNNFGLGKTHLQMAAAKWIMNNIQVRDELAHGKESDIVRGCRILCISDVSFMEDLIQAKMANDNGESLNKLVQSAATVDILLWDDLGKSKWSETKESLYYQIINERYRNKRPILFSSNEDQGTLSEKIGYAAASRLFGMTGNTYKFLYEVEGADYRLRKGAS